MVKNFLLSIMCLFTAFQVDSSPILSAIAEERAIPGLGIVELSLKNGIKICLKPTESDDGEVLIQGFAPGGYTSVPAQQRASAQLAAAIGWESGVGKYSVKELSQYLYNSELELALYVGPNSHSIEGCAPPENLSHLLNIIKDLFNTPRYEKEAMPIIVNRALDSARHRTSDPEAQFEDMHKELNSGGLAALKPLTEREISAIDYHVAEDFYRNHFLNPNGFTFVLVGDFDLNSIKPLLAHSLGAISAISALPNKEPKKLEAKFPKGVIHQFLPNKNSTNECLTRVTFCLEVAKEPFDLKLWETATQVIETQLRRAFLKEVGSTHGIDVALELPLHPCCDPVWLTLEFRCPAELRNQLVDAALKEMRQLQNRGPSAEDLATAIKLQKCNDLFWENDNNYLLALLANHYQLGLNIEKLELQKDDDKLTSSAIFTFIKENIDLRNHTVVSLK